MISHALGGTLLYENDVCVGPPLRMRIMPLSRAKNRVANHNGFFWGSYDQSAFYILKNVNLEVSKHVLLLTVAHSAIIYLNYFRTHFLTQRLRYLAICRVLLCHRNAWLPPNRTLPFLSSSRGGGAGRLPDSQIGQSQGRHSVSVSDICLSIYH